jgi:hypothetical protein
MQGIDLAQLRQGFAGTQYRELVQHHIRRQSLHDLETGVAGTLQLLPKSVLSGMEIGIDEWNETARHEGFWKTDTVEVFDLMLDTARRLFLLHNASATDEDLFNVFQVFVLTHAIAASENRDLRKFAGIRKGLFG